MLTLSTRTVQLAHGPVSLLDLDRFRVYAEREVRFPQATARLRVIGESSLVTVHSEAGAWYELIACGVVEEASTCQVSVGPQPGSLASLAAAEPGCAYTGRIWSAPAGEAPVETGSPHSVEFRFPGAGDPITRIEVQEAEGGLRLRTRHDYPEHGAVIWSESEWRL